MASGAVEFSAVSLVVSGFFLQRDQGQIRRRAGLSAISLVGLVLWICARVLLLFT